MYIVKKKLEVAIAHRLDLPYASPCNTVHGQNLTLTIWCVAEYKEDLEYGMVIDFAKIKAKIHGALDHKNLNDIFPFRPTAENLACWIHDQLAPQCKRVDVQESEGNVASFLEPGISTAIIAVMQ